MNVREKRLTCDIPAGRWRAYVAQGPQRERRHPWLDS